MSYIPILKCMKASLIASLINPGFTPQSIREAIKLAFMHMRIGKQLQWVYSFTPQSVREAIKLSFMCLRGQVCSSSL